MKREWLVLTLLFFAICAQAEPQISEDLVGRIYSDCLETNKKSVRSFEKKYRVSLADVISTNLQNEHLAMHARQAFAVGSAKAMCGEMLGQNYGKVKFISQPTNAKILIGNDEQKRNTDALFMLPVGDYTYRIRPSAKLECSGPFRILKDKTIAISCPSN